MTRVVFDTNVLYSAILKPASVPAKAVLLIASGLVIPCISDDVLAEYRNVLSIGRISTSTPTAGANCSKPSSALPST